MESKLLPNFPNSAKKVSNINANAKVSTTRRWLSSRPAHSPVSSLASGNVSRCDRRCDQAVVMTIGARKHRFHGPGAADVNRRVLKAGSVFDSFLAYLGWLIAKTFLPASGNVSRCQAAHCRKGQGARHRLRCSPSDRKSTRLNSSHEWISYAVF